LSASGTGLTLASGLLAAAARRPDTVAIECEGRVLTYRQLARHIRKLTHAAAALRLPQGSHVTLLAPNCLEYVELVAGLSAAGFAVVTANPNSSEAELRLILEDSGSLALFVHPSCEELARRASEIDAARFFVIGDQTEAWRDRGDENAPHPAVPEGATFAISYTSGTTGRPKGVMLSHRSRVLTFLAMAGEYGCYGPDDRTLAVAPLYHGGGFAFGVAPLFFGGRCRILTKFEPEAFLRSLEEFAATNVFVVPTHLHALSPFTKGSRGRYPALRAMISNAAPLPQRAKEQAVEDFGEGLLFECYGSTEAGIVSNLRPADQLRKRDCVGQAFPCTEIAVLGDDGEVVEPGAIGTVYSRSPYLFSGYWKRPDDSASARRGDWVTAGDLGRVDDEGYLYIEGRTKDMILSGGVNVYPSEIEQVLQTFPGVREATAVGIPDAHWGERIVACVVSDGGVDASELESHCRKLLSAHKVPKGFRFLESLPRNPTGKLLRRVLREELQRADGEQA
jgi:long-chain acyl-CoA synthetase